MSKVYFCSDTHFGHKNISNYRKKFSSVEEHDAFIYDSIVSTVKKRDTLWVLGDVCFDMNSFSFVKEIANKVNQLIIVPGNHDFEKTCAPKIEDYLSIPNVKIKPMTVYKGFWITHAPIHPSELRGKRNIHGHTHFENVDENNYYNVSMENINYRPILFQELVENINNFSQSA
jgi:calcineurin-like phosphoesterase family protein